MKFFKLFSKFSILQFSKISHFEFRFDYLNINWKIFWDSLQDFWRGNQFYLRRLEPKLWASVFSTAWNWNCPFAKSWTTNIFRIRSRWSYSWQPKSVSWCPKIHRTLICWRRYFYYWRRANGLTFAGDVAKTSPWRKSENFYFNSRAFFCVGKVRVIRENFGDIWKNIGKNSNFLSEFEDNSKETLEKFMKIPEKVGNMVKENFKEIY